MSIIRNTTFTYQEYKAYRQTHKDCCISGRTPYSMIGNNSETDNKNILENTVITAPHSNVKYEMTAEYADNFSEDTPFIKVTISNAGTSRNALLILTKLISEMLRRQKYLRCSAMLMPMKKIWDFQQAFGIH